MSVPTRHVDALEEPQVGRRLGLRVLVGDERDGPVLLHHPLDGALLGARVGAVVCRQQLDLVAINGPQDQAADGRRRHQRGHLPEHHQADGGAGRGRRVHRQRERADRVVGQPAVPGERQRAARRHRHGKHVQLREPRRVPTGHGGHRVRAGLRRDQREGRPQGRQEEARPGHLPGGGDLQQPLRQLGEVRLDVRRGVDQQGADLPRRAVLLLRVPGRSAQRRRDPHLRRRPQLADPSRPVLPSQGYTGQFPPRGASSSQAWARTPTCKAPTLDPV